MRGAKRIISIVLAAVAVTALLSSCKNGNGGGNTAGETVINIRVMNEVENVDRIIEEYKRRVKDDPVLSKITPNITNTGGANYVEKLKMSITAQEDFDLMFYGSFFGMSDSIKQGVAKDVSSYFNSDEYPGLKAAFSEEYLDANRTDGALYTIPIAEAYEDIRGLLIREDLRKKYNIPEVTNDDILLQFLQVIKENEPDIIPFTGGFLLFETEHFEAPHHNLFPVEVAGFDKGTMFVGLDEDWKNVVDLVIAGDEPERFAKFEEGYNTDFITASHEKMLKWAPYMDPDRAGGGVQGKEFAVGYSTVSQWPGHQKSLKEKHPDADYSLYVTDKRQRDLEEGAIFSEMKSNNFIIVPSWSKKTEQAMKFLDWMFGSQENHDLFQFGVEGVDWEAIGDDAYRPLDVPEKEKYIIPPYTLTWNPTYIRYLDTVKDNPQIKAYYDYSVSEKPYKRSPLAGFSFDPTPVKTEIASVQALVAPVLKNLKLVIYGDETAAVIKQLNTDVKNAGFEKIRAEIISQVQAFLDNQNK